MDLAAWMKSYDKLRSRVSSLDLLFPGHDPLMTTRYEKVTEEVTKLA
jgi:glyoxylase-like metal-dependent hydrolase (beta-lactamase superfamily II)